MKAVCPETLIGKSQRDEDGRSGMRSQGMELPIAAEVRTCFDGVYFPGFFLPAEPPPAGA